MFHFFVVLTAITIVSLLYVWWRVRVRVEGFTSTSPLRTEAKVDSPATLQDIVDLYTDVLGNEPTGTQLEQHMARGDTLEIVHRLVVDSDPYQLKAMSSPGSEYYLKRVSSDFRGIEEAAEIYREYRNRDPPEFIRMPLKDIWVETIYTKEIMIQFLTSSGYELWEKEIQFEIQQGIDRVGLIASVKNIGEFDIYKAVFDYFNAPRPSKSTTVTDGTAGTNGTTGADGTNGTNGTTAASTTGNDATTEGTDSANKEDDTTLTDIVTAEGKEQSDTVSVSDATDLINQVLKEVVGKMVQEKTGSEEQPSLSTVNLSDLKDADAFKDQLGSIEVGPDGKKRIYITPESTSIQKLSPWGTPVTTPKVCHYLGAPSEILGRRSKRGLATLSEIEEYNRLQPKTEFRQYFELN